MPTERQGQVASARFAAKKRVGQVPTTRSLSQCIRHLECAERRLRKLTRNFKGTGVRDEEMEVLLVKVAAAVSMIADYSNDVGDLARRGCT